MRKTKWCHGLRKKAIIVSLVLAPAATAHANCEVGRILFRDMFYGTIMGTGVGALVMAANESTNRVGQHLATGALIGLGVGAAIGIVEIALSEECKTSSSSKGYSYQDPTGFHVAPLVTVVNLSNLTYDKVTSSFDNIKNALGMGVHFSYNFSE